MIDEALKNKFRPVDPKQLSEYIIKTLKTLDALEEKGMLPEVGGKKASVTNDFLNAVSEVTLEDGTRVKRTALDFVNEQCKKCNKNNEAGKAFKLAMFAENLQERGAKTFVEMEQDRRATRNPMAVDPAEEERRSKGYNGPPKNQDPREELLAKFERKDPQGYPPAGGVGPGTSMRKP
jgi:hypothetical protein